MLKEYAFCVLFNRVVHVIREKRDFRVDQYGPGWIPLDAGISLIEPQSMDWRTCPGQVFHEAVIEVAAATEPIIFPLLNLPVNLATSKVDLVNYPFELFNIGSFHHNINCLLLDLFGRDYQAITARLQVTHRLVMTLEEAYIGHIYLGIYEKKLGVIGIRKSVFTNQTGVAKKMFKEIISIMHRFELETMEFILQPIGAIKSIFSKYPQLQYARQFQLSDLEAAFGGN